MPIRHLGYACQNMHLSKKNVRMSTVRKATFESGGEDIVAEKIIHNLKTLTKILEWNVDHGIYSFRMGAEIFPWVGNYDPTKFKRFDEIAYEAGFAGEYARDKGVRLSSHPGPFNVLCSPRQDVVDKTIRELEGTSQIFDLLGFEPSHNTKINIHVGGAYGDKVSALEAWTKNYYKLSESLRQRLVIENDDKRSLYSVQDLHGLHELCNGELPITFDFFHHKLHPDGLSEKEALGVAVSTWPEGIVPVTHYSESRRHEHLDIIDTICSNNRIPKDQLHEWPTLQAAQKEWGMIKENAHSDYIDGPIESYDYTIDVMIEAKAKELALLGLRDSAVKAEGRQAML